MENWNRHQMRVRYQETDQMGVVYHANYLNWFEIGRTEWIRSLGLTYRDIEAKGLYLPVTDAKIHYKKPARYDDKIEVQTRLVSFTNVRMKFAYRLLRENDLLVEGETDHVWVGRNFRPVRLDKIDLSLYTLLKNQLQMEEGG